jgi:hypothetical protein
MFHMKGRKDPTPLDADPQSDAALKRALAALALDQPRTEELARVRRRLQPLFEQAPPGRMPVPRTWRLHLLTFVGAAVLLGAALLGQRLGRDTKPPPASRPTPISVYTPRANPPESPPKLVSVGLATETTMGPASTREQAHPVSGHKPPPPIASHKRGVREASSARTTAPRAAGAAHAAMGQALSETSAPQATPSETANDSTPQPQSTKPKSAEEPQPAAASIRERPDEVSLLQQARRRAGSDPQAALRFLDEHKQRFPQGTLSPEREVLAIELLRGLSRNKEAELRAGAFQRDFPGSVYLPRVMH